MTIDEFLDILEENQVIYKYEGSHSWRIRDEEHLIPQEFTIYLEEEENDDAWRMAKW